MIKKLGANQLIVSTAYHTTALHSRDSIVTNQRRFTTYYLNAT